MDVKQFGMNLDEVVELADHLPDAAAVVKARVPKSVVDDLNALNPTQVDTSILKSGSLTVEGGAPLDTLNAAVESIEQAF